MFENFSCEIKVDSPEMRLKRLSLEDTESIFNLVQQNADHLTKYGDYADLVVRSLDDWSEILEPPSDSELTMGMFRQHELFGTVSLIYYKPKVFGLGYWIDAHHLGRGYVTNACQALVRFAEPNARLRKSGLVLSLRTSRVLP